MWKESITAELVSCLIAEQFPQWSNLDIRPVTLDGWDNTTFRLGDTMSVRLPSAVGYVPQVAKEHRWLPELASQLPLPVPLPIAMGEPGCGYDAPWSVYGWLDGEPAATAGVTDLDALAADLARFLVALQQIPAADGPPAGAHSAGRGGPVSTWDEETRAVIELLAGEIDADGAVAVWEAALASPWTGPDVWVHGDVTGSNLLVRDGRLCGVIDFGCSAVGDPACDLTPAWTMFEGASRERFRRGLALDAGTWARARGWALWKAAIAIPGRSRNDPERFGARFGWRWDAADVIARVIADAESS